MNISLVDLKTQYASISEEINEVVIKVFERGNFILGAYVDELESDIADYLGTKYAVGVGSGTDALMMSLRGFGIGPGDEVIVPAYTFFATSEVVSTLGATPVFVDIDPNTYCIDVDKIAEKITVNTKAIMPVHLFGHPVDMDPLMNIANENGLIVVEDNAQAFGAEYKGVKTGTIGNVGCLSFFPTKNLACYGDGGMIVTNDEHLAETVRKLRTHGWASKYQPEMIAYNSRLDEVQAAIVSVKLKYIDDWNRKRRKAAARYTKMLSSIDITLPVERDLMTHVYNLYTVRLSNRDKKREFIKSKGIATGVYYPQALHELDLYKELKYSASDMPESSRASYETLALPMYPELSDEQIEAIVDATKCAQEIF